MKKMSDELQIFPSAAEDDLVAFKQAESKQTRSEAYRIAYTDRDFLLRDETRPARLQLEHLKTELSLQDNNINSTIVIFGSARIRDLADARHELSEARTQLSLDNQDSTCLRRVKLAEKSLENAKFYSLAREFCRLMTENAIENPIFEEPCSMVVMTGGGGGIMEAANRGAADANGKSIGLNIVLPTEQNPNAYITPELCFQFHYFAIRKMHFLTRAKALAVFPGGYGTLDELFETLTLLQTERIKPVPIVLFGQAYWERLINFEMLVDEGVIDAEDLNLFTFAESAKEGLECIQRFYSI